MPDGDIEVCAVQDGIRLCGIVSSMHLVDTKFNQIKLMLSGQATTDRLSPDDHDDIEEAA